MTTWQDYAKHAEKFGPADLLETALETEVWAAKDYGLLVQRMLKVDADRFARESAGNPRHFIEPAWKPSREQVRGLALKLNDDGIEPRKIAQYLGISRSTVTRALQDALEADLSLHNGPD